MTENQDGEDDWSIANFLHIGPAKSKKKKRQHAGKEAGKVPLVEENHTVNPKIDGLQSLSVERHIKKKRKHHEAKFQDSDMDVQIEDKILEPENHHIRSEQKSVKIKVHCNAMERLEEDRLRVKVIKKSIREQADNEWEGNIDDVANERGLHGVSDECSSRVKKHKKRKTDSSEMEDTSANPSEDCVANTSVASKTEKRHKKSKNKARTVEGVPSVSETGEVDVPDSKNLEMFVQKEKDAENECHPEKKRKKKKQAREQHASAEQLQMEPVVSDCEMHGEPGYLGQTEHSTEPANREQFLKMKPAHRSSKHRNKNSETVEVPISTHTKACIVEPETLSGDMSDERSFAQVTHGSAHKKKKRKKKSVAEQTVSAANERSYETESMGDGSYGAVEDWVLANEAAFHLLEEFVPNIRTKSQYTIKNLIKYDLQRFLTFKEQGIPIRNGRFSAEENEQLQRNMETYLELTGIDSADKVLQPFRYPEETKAIKAAKRLHLLHHWIAVGIPRSWALIKSRAKKIFDPYNYKGRYSTEEIKELRRRQATCGNNWSQISNWMARSNHSVALKFSQIRNPINNKGSWSKAEMKRLVQAVQHYLQNSQSHHELENMAARMAQSSTGEVMSLVREKLCKGIPWVEVEAKVGTRNWMQCKIKWSGFLTKKMTRGAKVYHGQNALRAKIRIIQRLYESQVEDSSELNWEDLAECIGNVPPAYVQNKFYNLKSRYVPSWHTKTFTEIVDHLHDKILPKLESVLKEKKTDEETPLEELQNVYQFADIFQDSDLDGSDPEDQ